MTAIKLKEGVLWKAYCLGAGDSKENPKDLCHFLDTAISGICQFVFWKGHFRIQVTTGILCTVCFSILVSVPGYFEQSMVGLILEIVGAILLLCGLVCGGVCCLKIMLFFYHKFRLVKILIDVLGRILFSIFCLIVLIGPLFDKEFLNKIWFFFKALFLISVVVIFITIIITKITETRHARLLIKALKTACSRIRKFKRVVCPQVLPPPRW